MPVYSEGEFVRTDYLLLCICVYAFVCACASMCVSLPV